MARGTAVGVTSPFRGVTPRPVWFLHLATGLASPANVYYTTSDKSETWNSLTWSPRPLGLPNVEASNQGESFDGAIEIGDADGVLAGYIDTSGATFADVRAVLYLTDRTVVEAGGTAEISETFVCEGYERGEGYLRLHVRSLMSYAANVETPLRVFTKTDFPGLVR